MPPDVIRVCAAGGARGGPCRNEWSGSGAEMPQFPHGLLRKRARALAVRSRPALANVRTPYAARPAARQPTQLDRIPSNALGGFMSRLALELRFALRSVVRARFISTLAVLAFALGIGVTTAVFSIFNGVLLRPLPYPKPMQIVSVYDTQPACATCPGSWPKYHDGKARKQVFSAIGGSTQASFVMTGRGDPTRVPGVSTTASLADVFGVQPALGRWYTAQEDQPGGPKVVVLTHDFWMKRLGGDRQIVGQTLTLDGQPYDVIGVMPPGFAHR